jgi:hypothetical protein
LIGRPGDEGEDIDVGRMVENALLSVLVLAGSFSGVVEKTLVPPVKASAVAPPAVSP